MRSIVRPKADSSADKCKRSSEGNSGRTGKVLGRLWEGSAMCHYLCRQLWQGLGDADSGVGEYKLA